MERPPDGEKFACAWPRRGPPAAAGAGAATALPLPLPKVGNDELHYKPFDELYGSAPDPCLPAKSANARRPIDTGSNSHNSGWAANPVRFVMSCRFCSKSRCIFGKRPLARAEKAALADVEYTCGAELFSEGPTGACRRALHKKAELRDRHGDALLPVHVERS